MPFIPHLKEQIECIPALGGSYALLLFLERGKELFIPRFGSLWLVPGFYVYFGSAMGPGGIRARLRHHLQIAVQPHWHIDYLRREADLNGVYYCVSSKPLECTWTQVVLKMEDVHVPVCGFGASDCKQGCDAHLLYSPFSAIIERLPLILDMI